MTATDRALMAHLLRRSGFGATFQELDRYCDLGYEAAVEEILHPEQQPGIEEDILERYFIDWKESRNIEGALTEFVYRMNAYSGLRPLQEKIALFWHGVFATGLAKVLHEKTVLNQIDMFREDGLGNFRDLLLGLAKDPAMIFWLDNNFNHNGAPNENWGRELLELFSMGVGMDGKENYTEEDVKEAARAFTGWTVTNSIPRYPYGKYDAKFMFDPRDHDDEEKTFLGETGNFNGEDIVDIIVKQPATARFVARHLYNFFVADDVQVPAWKDTPPQDIEAIKMLEEEYFRSNYNITSMLRVLFKSDFFKNSTFAKVKSPAETVIGTLKLVGDFKFPRPGLDLMTMNIRYMGQDLLNPPTVEGWHTGTEWVDTGTLVERVNSSALVIGDTVQPGVQAMIQRLKDNQKSYQPDQLVDECLLLVGSLEVSEGTRQRLVEFAANWGEVKFTPEDAVACSERQVVELLQLILATREYQMA